MLDSSCNSQTDSCENLVKQIFLKMKKVKVVSKELNKKNFRKISTRVNQKKEQLNSTQRSLAKKPFDDELTKSEKRLREEYAELMSAEERFYRDKARINWLQHGDKNTAIFHRKVATHSAKNRILSLCNKAGEKIHDCEQVKSIAVKFYKKLFKKKASWL